MIAHNEVKSDISACKMQVDLLAADDSVLEREGEFRMEHNSCGMEDGMTVEYALDVRAEGYGEATVNAPVTISENSGHDFQMDRTLSAQGDAAIYAYMPVCFEYNYLKGHIGISSSLHAGSGNATVLAEGDVLVGISFPRYTSRTIEAMELARKKSATLVAITDGPLSPLHATSDLCLTAKSDMASFVDSLAAPLSLINALIVALSQRKRQQVAANFDHLEEIWAQYNVYLSKNGE